MNQITSINGAPADTTAALLQVLERAASNPDVDLDKMERLFQMRERILGHQAEQEFNSAMARAQARMGRVAADANNPQTRSRYSSYAAIDREIRPHYSAEGFAMSFDVESHPNSDWITVIAYLTHSGGHTRRYTQPMPADGKGAKGGDVMTKTHALGSAKTYGMRYLVKGIWNIATGDDPDDDDGNSASSPPIERLSEEQAHQIRAGLKSTGTTEAQFLNWALPRVRDATIEMIQAGQYETCMAMLRKKYKQQAEKKTEPEQKAEPTVEF